MRFPENFLDNPKISKIFGKSGNNVLPSGKEVPGTYLSWVVVRPVRERGGAAIAEEHLHF